MTGPRDPSSLLGDVRVITHTVMCQEYEDGKLYQVSIPRGAALDVARVGLSMIDPIELLRAVWSSVHSPWDIGQKEDKNLYLSLWVANE